MVGVGGTGGRAVERMVAHPVTGVQCLRVPGHAEDRLPGTGDTVPSQSAVVLSEHTFGPDRMPVSDVRDVIAQAETAHLLYVVADLGAEPETLPDTLAIARAGQDAFVVTLGAVTLPSAPTLAGVGAPTRADLAALADAMDALFLLPVDRDDDRAELLLTAVQSVTDLLAEPAFICFGLEDVRALSRRGTFGAMGIGIARGPGAARRAAEAAIASRSLGPEALASASGVLTNVTGGMGLTMDDYTEATRAISDALSEDTLAAASVVLKEVFEDSIRVSILAIGVDPALHPVFASARGEA